MPKSSDASQLVQLYKSRLYSIGWDIYDGFWRLFSFTGSSPRADLVTRARAGWEGEITADVCIVTNCTFPGGNAATTISEFRALEADGQTVVLINCSIKRSRWKWLWFADRYSPVAHRLAPAHRVRRVRCRTAIVRGPRMLMTKKFLKLSTKIEAQQSIIVVNNAAHDEAGRTIFSWRDLKRRIDAIDWPNMIVCPTGPLIREDAAKELEEADVRSLLSDIDWPPVIDETEFPFAPSPCLTKPLVIGRHARDHFGKWPSSREKLLQIYPADDPDIRVSILGGTETVEQSLGGTPRSWHVEPFGIGSVQQYLSDLDVFVYFPNETRREAFGRTIIEANYSGIPVVLPRQFAPTFGDLAIYCSPRKIREVIDRLQKENEARQAYLHACRDLAKSLFGTPSLVKRVEAPTRLPRPTMAEHDQRNRKIFIPEIEYL